MDADLALDLMLIMRKLYDRGNRAEARVLYRKLELAWDELEYRNLWEGDDAQTRAAVEVIMWMCSKDDMPPFKNEPEWLSAWFSNACKLHKPLPVPKPLSLRCVVGSDKLNTNTIGRNTQHGQD